MIRWTYLPIASIPDSIRRQARTPLMGALNGDDLKYIVTIGETQDPTDGWPVALWGSDGSGTYSILDSVVGTFGYDPKDRSQRWWKKQEDPQPGDRFVLMWAEKMLRHAGLG